MHERYILVRQRFLRKWRRRMRARAVAGGRSHVARCLSFWTAVMLMCSSIALPWPKVLVGGGSAAQIWTLCATVTVDLYLIYCLTSCELSFPSLSHTAKLTLSVPTRPDQTFAASCLSSYRCIGVDISGLDVTDENLARSLSKGLDRLLYLLVSISYPLYSVN